MKLKLTIEQQMDLFEKLNKACVGMETDIRILNEIGYNGLASLRQENLDGLISVLEMVRCVNVDFIY